MLQEEIVDFLKNVIPFNLLSGETLGKMAADIAMDYSPRGEEILQQDGPPSEFLGIIKKGGVKVFQALDNDEEVVLDLRGEGEHFGMLSILSGDRSRNNVVAIEDTICYKVPRKTVLALLQENHEVNQYFIKSFFVNLLDKTYEETRKAYTGGTTGEQLLFSTAVRDIVRAEPRTVALDTTIQQAAADMAAQRIGSLVVVDSAGQPLGMVTDRDFREKVVAVARDVAAPVREIMSAPLISVDAEDNCFEALMKMIRHRIHHILILENGRLLGLLTNHDFMLLQGSSPTVLVKEIAHVRTIAELQGTAPKFYKAVSSLLRHGARPHNITGMITELLEKICNTVVDIFEKDNGPGPVPYSLFFFGAGGRHELTLSFGVEMGIVHQDAASPDAAKETAAYFNRLAETLNSAMQNCRINGAGQCLQAANIRAASAWREGFKKWGTGAGTGLDAGFFDMRAVRGEKARVDSLREYLEKRTGQSRGLMEAVAAETLHERPPLGFFKNFVVEKGGGHKNELDLYRRGILPLVGCARIFSLAKGVARGSTLGRLKELTSRHGFKVAEDMGQAFGYLNSQLIRSQLHQAEEGLTPDNFINPYSLTNFERKTLKESFQLTARLYDEIEGDYWSGKVLP
ncbi:MAG: CBS domain-containing protein [Deltaproteobacteria bacterium]|jgi:CBS domain-containing protein|nr:CBS domain-containing protein [Deltaproteobacteria bacterium]